MSKDHLYERIETSEQLTPQELGELASIIRSPLVLKGLALVLEEARNKDTLSLANLSTEDGLKSALGRQGEVRGLKRAVEILLEIEAPEAKGENNVVGTDENSTES